MSQTKDNLIVAQTASKVAGELFQGKGASVLNSGDFATAVELIYSTILDVVGDDAETPPQLSQQQAEDKVIEAFTPPSGEAPVRVDQDDIPVPVKTEKVIISGHTPGAPKPLHGKSTMVQKCEDAFFHNPDDWTVFTSGEGSVHGGTKPDLSHKTLEVNGYKLAIWLYDSKFGKHAPEWAYIEAGFANEFASLVADGKIKP